MIRIETIEIEECRGIKKLTLPLARRNFGICGPNGTGKSGVVDAIEFALTGEITRLGGSGTGDLSVKAHAPHVDARATTHNVNGAKLPGGSPLANHFIKRFDLGDDVVAVRFATLFLPLLSLFLLSTMTSASSLL